MTMRDSGLEALLERSALGDRSAFARLYDQTNVRLSAVCLRVLKNRREAEAALADVYVKIWRYAERYPAAGVRPTTWMAAIARHHCIERLRATKAPAAVLSAASRTANATARADRRALARLGQGTLSAQVGTLDPQAAHLLRVAYFGGATYANLAARDGDTAGAVRVSSRTLFEALSGQGARTGIERTGVERTGGKEDNAAAAMEYALALLDEADRRVFERAMLDDPALSAAVWQAEEHLAPLAAALKPRRPSKRVWRKISRMAFAPAGGTVGRGARRAAAYWRALAGFFAIATVVAGCLVAAMVLRPDVLAHSSAEMVSALVSPDGDVTLVRLAADGTVHTAPFAGPLAAGQTPVLWLLPEEGEPVALGVLSPENPAVLTGPADIGGANASLSGARLTVTAEPAGTAPGAAPTGDTLATGHIQSI